MIKSSLEIPGSTAKVKSINCDQRLTIVSTINLWSGWFIFNERKKKKKWTTIVIYKTIMFRHFPYFVFRVFNTYANLCSFKTIKNWSLFFTFLISIDFIHDKWLKRKKVMKIIEVLTKKGNLSEQSDQMHIIFPA